MMLWILVYGNIYSNIWLQEVSKTVYVNIVKFLVSEGFVSYEVDAKLKGIMADIHANCVKYGTEPDGYINYVKGANIAGFMKVAKAMMAQGIV